MENKASENINANIVSEEEINWMLAHRSLDFDLSRCLRDYPKQGNEILEAFKNSKFEYLLPCVNWPGVGTRYRLFLDWCEKLDSKPVDCKDAFRKFSQHLGRVTSYRALSLTPEQFEVIKQKNTIWPTGRLNQTEEAVNNIVEKYGVWHVAYARLYIGRRLVEFDPSLSLHDDPETAVTIAGGYFNEGRQVYVMGVSVPKIEPLGIILNELQDPEGDAEWFKHRKVWFNSTWERTERYCLFEIPFFKERLQSLTILKSEKEIADFIQPFKEKMEKLYQEWKRDHGDQ